MGRGFGEAPGVRQRVVFDRPDQKAAMWEAYYRDSRRGRSWKGCENCLPERADPEAHLDTHHVIEQQRLKTWAKDHGQSALATLRLITDPRNSMLVCGACHQGQTSRMRRIRLAAIRREAWDFIREVDLLDEVIEDYRGEDEDA